MHVFVYMDREGMLIVMSQLCQNLRCRLLEQESVLIPVSPADLISADFQLVFHWHEIDIKSNLGRKQNILILLV